MRSAQCEGVSVMRLIALALLMVSTGAAAATTTELDCANDDPTQAHQSIVLNQDTGNATMEWVGVSSVPVVHPAAFSPNEVAITIMHDVDRIADMSMMIYIDRTTLRWHQTNTINGRDVTKGLSGQCKIVTNPDRKF